MRIKIVAGMLALAGCAPNVAVDSGRPMTAANPVEPNWTVQPDNRTVTDAFPAFAVMAGLSGSVTLNCAATPEGRLEDCTVVEAKPAGLGFDRTAMTLSREYRVSSRPGADQSPLPRVQYTSRYRMTADGAPPAWTGPEPTPERLALARVEATRQSDLERRYVAAPDWGVDPDRRAAVIDIILQVHAEFREREIQAETLALARTMTAEQLEALRSGARPAPVTDFAEHYAASAEQVALSGEQGARLRSLYCANYDCEAGD